MSFDRVGKESVGRHCKEHEREGGHPPIDAHERFPQAKMRPEVCNLWEKDAMAGAAWR
jgi:hypothetical protein